MDLSVVIMTFNEERNIGRCLASVKDIADNIVVVDTFSTDDTEKICRSFGADFIKKRPWAGDALTRNFGATQAKHDLVLTLDADEELSSELRRSIAAIKAGTEALSPAKFIRITNYCGKWIRHGGWYPDIKIRIYDRRKMQWQGIIHADLEGEGKNRALLLDGVCHHFSYYSIAEHIAKTKRYADLYGRELFAKGKRSSLLHMVFNPVIKFVRDYFFRFGFLDGKSGLVIAWITARGTFLKHATLCRLQRGG